MADSKLGPLEHLNRIIRENRIGEYSTPNLALGMRPSEFSRGASRWSWESQTPAALNPFGTVQGGYLTVFIDEMLSTAIGSVLEAGEWAVTAEVKVSYLRAVRPGALTGTARVIRRTRSLAFMEAAIAAADGEPSVTATSTWALSRM